MLELYAYNAGKGDCIRLRFGNGHNIFIDTGVTRFGPEFKKILQSIINAGETLDVLILTHVDNDHIGGLLSLLRIGYRCPFREVWMNHGNKSSLKDALLSTRENDEVYTRLVSQKISVSALVEGDVRMVEGAVIEVFHPGRDELVEQSQFNDAALARHSDFRYALSELAQKPIKKHDTSVNNKKSIVFTFSYEGRRLLFTGDAWAEDVVKASGAFDLVKLPHHGSVGNISDAFLQKISSQHFLICTDGREHPDKQTIAKLEKWYGEITVFSTAAWWKNGYFVADDKQHNIHYIQKEGLIVSW